MSRDIILGPSSDEPRALGSGDLSLDAWGIQKTSQAQSLFRSTFTFDIPPLLWTLHENDVELLDITTSLRSGSVNGMLSLKSGVTTNDESLLESKRHPRYQPNRGHLYSCSAVMPNPTNGQVDFGMFVHDENGVFFRRKEDGNLYACVLSNSVLTYEELITVPFPIDLTKGNVYDIQMQWRGVGNINFYITSHITGVPEIVHTISYINNLSELSIQNPALSCAVKAVNVSGTESEIKIGCVDITSEGGNVETEQYGTAIGTNTVSVNDPIIAIRSPDLIDSRINTRDIRLARVSINSDKKTKAALYVTRDVTAFVGGAWTSSDGSFIEANSTLTSVDLAKMRLVTTTNIEANSTSQVTNPSPQTIEFYLIHGDHACVVCTDGAVALMTGIIEWGEQT